jgi:rRNA processing protein Gar1
MENSDLVIDPKAKPKVGQKVYLPDLDCFGEVVEIHDRVKSWITKIKVTNADGSTSFLEVSNLAVEALVIINDVVASEAFKTLWTWLKNLFKKKKNKQPKQ